MRFNEFPRRHQLDHLGVQRGHVLQRRIVKGEVRVSEEASDMQTFRGLGCEEDSTVQRQMNVKDPPVPALQANLSVGGLPK